MLWHDSNTTSPVNLASEATLATSIGVRTAIGIRIRTTTWNSFILLFIFLKEQKDNRENDCRNPNHSSRPRIDSKFGTLRICKFQRCCRCSEPRFSQLKVNCLKTKSSQTNSRIFENSMFKVALDIAIELHKLYYLYQQLTEGWKQQKVAAEQNSGKSR